MSVSVELSGGFTIRQRVLYGVRADELKSFGWWTWLGLFRRPGRMEILSA